MKTDKEITNEINSIFLDRVNPVAEVTAYALRLRSEFYSDSGSLRRERFTQPTNPDRLAEMNRHIEKLIECKAESEVIRCAVNDRHSLLCPDPAFVTSESVDPGSVRKYLKEVHSSVIWPRWRFWK